MNRFEVLTRAIEEQSARYRTFKEHYCPRCRRGQRSYTHGIITRNLRRRRTFHGTVSRDNYGGRGETEGRVFITLSRPYARTPGHLPQQVYRNVYNALGNGPRYISREVRILTGVCTMVYNHYVRKTGAAIIFHFYKGKFRA